MIEFGHEYYKQFGPFVILLIRRTRAVQALTAHPLRILNLAEAGLEGHALNCVPEKKKFGLTHFPLLRKRARCDWVRGGWNDAYLDESTSFPKGTFKDQVDASSDAFNAIVEEIHEPEPIPDQIVTYEERVSISPM